MYNRSSEHREQVIVMQWAKRNAYMWPELRWLMAIPNGVKLPGVMRRGKRYSPQAMTLKAEGALKPGISDMFLPAARGGFHGLWIELKHDDNTLSESQEKFCEAMLNAGYLAVACWESTETIATLRSYLKGEMKR